MRAEPVAPCTEHPTQRTERREAPRRLIGAAAPGGEDRHGWVEDTPEDDGKDKAAQELAGRAGKRVPRA